MRDGEGNSEMSRKPLLLPQVWGTKAGSVLTEPSHCDHQGEPGNTAGSGAKIREKTPLLIKMFPDT